MRSSSLLTPDEVAALLRVRRARVYSLVRDGLLPAVRIGRQVRVDGAVLERWVAAGGCGLGSIDDRGTKP